MLARSHCHLACTSQCNRSPADVARERGTFKAMRRLHEAHREWGEVQYLFQDEATCVRACASFGIRCASVWLAPHPLNGVATQVCWAGDWEAEP